MYPPSLVPSCDLQDMIDETIMIGRHADIENMKRSSRTSHHVGAALNKRQTLHKKPGARKLRASPAGFQNRHPRAQEQHEQQQHHHHHHHRHARLADVVNNNNGGGVVVFAHAGPTNHEHVSSHGCRQTTVLTLHHLKQGVKKELLKSKSGRAEKVTQPNGQSVHSLSKHEHLGQNLNGRIQRNRHSGASGGVSSAKKSDGNCRPKPSPPLQLCNKDGRKLLNVANSVKIVNVYPDGPLPEESLKDAEKVYAGAKFSEPPSPSVLPKPPSHWVGEKGPQHSDSSKEQMTVHLKNLLKVQAKS
ncbi:proline-rich nuclear receptor coactivator 1 [Scleropages formosus]|uniref:proline-rich nuclear receptor coactivator 1 n=1 Tax=Scleropages formosus TaxID=113540 RepID=UPI0010FA9DE3|nr:proline-rich nuclear receptor coactivator 1 [Scleropages formosus]